MTSAYPMPQRKPTLSPMPMTTPTPVVPGGASSMMIPPELNIYNGASGGPAPMPIPQNHYTNYSNPNGSAPAPAAGTWSSSGVGQTGGGWVPSNAPIPGYMGYGADGPGGMSFGANGPSAPGTGGLNPSVSVNGKMYDHLTDIYGGGLGPMIGKFMAGGAGYNPAVGQAFINQMWPDVMRGNAQILDAFGDTGQRFSSTAALGQADFFDRVMKSFGAIQAGLYSDAVNREQHMMEGLQQPFQQANAADMGWMDYLNMGLNVAGSVAGALLL